MFFKYDSTPEEKLTTLVLWKTNVIIRVFLLIR